MFQRLATAIARARIGAGFRHLAGPRRFHLADDAAAVILVVRDGAYHLPYFFEWHRARGFDRFVVVDNGSRDATREIARAEPGTILAATDADFGRHEPLIRYAASTMFTRGGWSLIADADELFDWPGDEDLQGLLRGLNADGHTGVVAQMLDMFPRRFADLPAGIGFGAAVAAMDHADLSAVTRHGYFDPEIPFHWFLAQNRLADRDVPLLFGGIRQLVFGENPCLTKHPLIRNGAGVVPGEHPHVSRPLSVAGFTTLLRHYKFTGDYIDRDRERAARGSFGTDEYARRAAQFDREGMTEFWRPSSFRFTTPEDLIGRGFLNAGQK
ncbi:MAG: glycosyltransferase family 2 protein [Rhodobacteraceae bacterium]|nr:glycosyltransferase family 2 protein [Paracoccaceae bacterium]